MKRVLRSSSSLSFDEDSDSYNYSQDDTDRGELASEDLLVGGKNGEHTLPLLETAVCACILEDSIDQLQILGALGKALPMHGDLRYETLEQKFSVDVPETQLFDPQTLERSETVIAKHKHVKFESDRSFVEKVLKDTLNSLMIGNNYRGLLHHLEKSERLQNEEAQLIEKAAKQERELEELKRLIKTERHEALAQLRSQRQLIGILKDKIQDTFFENKIKLNYVNMWEDSRIEQNDLRLQNLENKIRDDINDSKIKMERENRIKSEIEAHMAEIQSDIEDKILYWMERYDREVESRDVEISLLKTNREQLYIDMTELTRLYELHKYQMEKFLREKEARRLEAERQENMRKAAIRIQAWWRGTMVRRGLGPFKALAKAKAAASAKPAKGKKK